MRNMLFLLTLFCVIFLILTTIVTYGGPFAPKKKRRFGPRLVIFVYFTSIIQVLITLLAYRLYQ